MKLDTTQGRSKSPRQVGLAMGVALAICAAVRLPYGFGPFSVDEYVYVTMGRELLAGALPLTTAWLNKSPIGYVVYAIPAALPFDIDVSLTLFALALSTATALFLFLLARRHLDARWAWFSLVSCALTSADPATQANGANMEIPIGLLVVLALWLAYPGPGSSGRRRLFFAAATLGFAAGIKETAVAFAIALLPGCRWRSSGRERVRDLATLVAGLVLPTAVVWTVYSAAGQVEPLMAVLSYHREYSALKLIDLIRGPLLLLVSRGDAFYVYWPLLLPAAWLLVDVPWRAGLEMVARSLVVAAGAAVVAPWYFFAHYYAHFQLPLILGTAVWLSRMQDRVRSRWLIPGVAVTILLWLGALELRMASGRMPLVVRALSPVTATGQLERDLGRELKASAAPEDRLFIFGWAPTVHAHSGLRPAAPDVWGMTTSSQVAVSRWTMADWLVRRTKEALQERPPEWIIVAEEPRAGEVDLEIEALLESEYSEVGFDWAKEVARFRVMRVFRRRSPAPPS